MSEYCVVVAGGAKARIYTLEPAELPELQSGPNLVERRTLSNPQRQARAADIYAEVRSGRNRPAIGPGHGVHDHREESDREADRRFARNIAAEVSELVGRNGYQHVVLCAERRMLGLLRPSLTGSLDPKGIQVHEVAKDLLKLDLRQLHDRLARTGHLPPRREPRATVN